MNMETHPELADEKLAEIENLYSLHYERLCHSQAVLLSTAAAPDLQGLGSGISPIMIYETTHGLDLDCLVPQGYSLSTT